MTDMLTGAPPEGEKKVEYLELVFDLVFVYMVGRNGVREHDRGSMRYMTLHVFIVFFINNFTASLVFMREPEMAFAPKMAFLLFSIVGYYGFLFTLGRYLKPRYRENRRLVIMPACVTAAFVTSMVILRETATAHVAPTTAYTLTMFAILYRATREMPRGSR